MKNKIKFILCSILFASICFGIEGDYYFSRLNSSGLLEPKSITPSLSSLVGWTSDLNQPVSISVDIGVLTFLSTPTLANFNTALSGADVATTGENTFGGAQTITTSAATTSAPGFLTTQSWSGSTAALVAVSNNVVDSRTGAAIGGYLERWQVNGVTALAILRGDQYGNGLGGLWSDNAPIQFISYGLPYAMVGGNYAGSGLGINYSSPTNGFLSWQTGQNWAVQYGDLHIGRGGAGIVQLGKPLASTWVSQQITPAGAIVGTTTNGSPTNELRLTGSVSTGTGTGGDVVISTYGTNGVSGTAIGTLTERVRVKSNGQIFLNLPTSAGATGSLWNDGGTVKVSP